jgi:hypothetical protein
VTACAKSEGLASVTILADKPPGSVDKEKMAGGDGKPIPLPLAFRATMVGTEPASESAPSHSLNDHHSCQDAPRSPGTVLPTCEVGQQSVWLATSGSQTHFCGRDPHPLLTAEVTKKLDSVSGRFSPDSVNDSCFAQYNLMWHRGTGLCPCPLLWSILLYATLFRPSARLFRLLSLDFC